jgi:chromosome partitioning protein
MARASLALSVRGTGVSATPSRAAGRAGGLTSTPTAAQALADDVGPTGRPLPDFPEPAPLVGHGPAPRPGHVQPEGGVGKTTSTINLGAALAEAGRRVLLVDLDPQGRCRSAWVSTRCSSTAPSTTCSWSRRCPWTTVMLKTGVAGMDLLPSNIDLSAAEVQLVERGGPRADAGAVLAPVLDDYDIVLIDCQPSLGLLHGQRPHAAEME